MPICACCCWSSPLNGDNLAKTSAHSGQHARNGPTEAIQGIGKVGLRSGHAHHIGLVWYRVPKVLATSHSHDAAAALRVRRCAHQCMANGNDPAGNRARSRRARPSSRASCRPAHSHSAHDHFAPVTAPSRSPQARPLTVFEQQAAETIKITNAFRRRNGLPAFGKIRCVQRPPSITLRIWPGAATSITSRPTAALRRNATNAAIRLVSA